MIRFFTSAFLTLIYFATMQEASALEPRFEDYKVEQSFVGPNHELAKEHNTGDNFSKYRQEALKRPTNFADHYIVMIVGCGGGAICGEILDAKTGRVSTVFPNAYSTGSDKAEFPFGVDFHENSRLIVIDGVSEDLEKDQNGLDISGTNRKRFFELKDGALILLKSVKSD